MSEAVKVRRERIATAMLAALCNTVGTISESYYPQKARQALLLTDELIKAIEHGPVAREEQR